jgi:hypothetical protein
MSTSDVSAVHTMLRELLVGYPLYPDYSSNFRVKQVGDIPAAYREDYRIRARSSKTGRSSP